ncbi:ATP-binding cassette sub-family A member 7 [Rhipicephalus sanguineus]|uniref:ATP-binding cassette sub-family A member 7 n=1 Tax=Rhipicephalus sanguineus TaxID=34632 RepID=UPI0020C24F12|nr:ATP-binding cassette sub-family A member 7 [Rhipicephalus sanguineus]
MYTVDFSQDAAAYADGINPVMVTVSFLLFVVGQSIIPVFVTAVFPKGWVRTLLFVALITVAPATVSPTAVTVPGYLTTTRRSKLFAGILPQSGLISVMIIMFLAQDYEGGAGWSVVTRRVMGNNVTILEIWLLMFTSDVGIVFLTWYLPQILPWCTDTPRNPLFLLTLKYWKRDEARVNINAAPLYKDPTRFEELPPDVRPIVQARNLTKFIGTVPVLNGLDLNVYERKVTVLLGHNGAGKSTLMRILTGTLGGPTSGVAIVCGHDVYNDREMVHSQVALCEQSDLFFDDMSCGENALYFASLKDGHGTDVQKATASMLKKLGLEDEKDKMPSEVSCATLRMLSLAIAIASQPKLLMLDEPTTGVDPATRRKMWDILRKIGKERTLMFSSHDMFEVDAVAEQIVVMAAGTVICSGSMTFLKKACGVGYTITLVKEPRLFNMEGALAVVRKAIPGARVHVDAQSAVSIRLGTFDHSGFPGLFETLERSSAKLGIADIGLTVATVKDVYSKRTQGEYSDLLHPSPEISTQQESARRTRVFGGDVAVLCKPVSKRNRTSAQCFEALFMKRLTYMRRSWGIFLVSYVLPLVQPAPSPKGMQHEQELYHLYGASEIRLGYNFPGYAVVLQGGAAAAANLSRALVVLVEAEGGSVRNVSDFNKTRVGDDLAIYVRTYPMAILLEPDRVRLMVDPTDPLTVPVLLNLVDTAVLRLLTRQPTARIVARVSQLEVRKFSGRESIFLFWTVGCPITYALAFSAFAAFPAAERLNGARDIQLMTGLSGGFFVASHAAFDFVHYVAFAVPWCLIYWRGAGNSADTCALIFATFVLSSPSMIGMAYLTSERALTELGAMYSHFLWIYFSGIVLYFGARLFILLGVEVMEYATLLFPPWALLSCLLKISSADIAAELCDRQRAAPSTSPTGQGRTPVNPTVSARAWRAIFPTWRVGGQLWPFV